MNMILHGNETSDIRQGNTLANPRFLNGKLDTFDYLVANPPFSNKTWKNSVENDFGRFDGYDSPPEEWRLRLLAAHGQVAQVHRQRRSHPST